MRARNIKPGFFKNEILGTSDPMLSILFEGLWCLADREGRLEDRPMRIKVEVFPYRENLDVNRYLTDLTRLKFIVRYVHDGVSYIQIVNFLKHQKPHKTEKASVIPALTVNDTLNNGEFTVKDTLDGGEETERERPDSWIHGFTDSLIPDSPSSEHPAPKKSAAPKKRIPTEYPPEFERLWEIYPRTGDKKKTFTLCEEWRAGGVSCEEMLRGAEGYAEACKRERTEEQYIKRPETFFGPGEHWRNYLNGKKLQRDEEPIRPRLKEFIPVNRRGPDYNPEDHVE